jgi:hypothetical protein
MIEMGIVCLRPKEVKLGDVNKKSGTRRENSGDTRRPNRRMS